MSINIDVANRRYSLRIRQGPRRYSLSETVYQDNIHGYPELVHTRLLYVNRSRDAVETEMARRADQLRRAAEQGRRES